jgi:hypothetical protein
MSYSRSLSAGARVAQAQRKDRPPVDPAKLEELRRDLAEARIADYIERTLAKFPPLTQEQRVRLAELLAPVRITPNGGDIGGAT